MSRVALAFDRSSTRQIDADGRLHVSVTKISKANICPYLGAEIPGWEELGLQPDRIYRMLRCPMELAAGAATFNNLPILDEHVPVDAFDEGSHRPEVVIGSTGTDAAFTDPYLENSAVIWSRSAIDDIQAADEAERTGLPNERARREWSCAYRYVPDMTAGNFRGLQYDGVMRNIIGNHVALVKEGRAGPDVMIGDCSMLKSRKALLLSGALVGLIRPKLAADAVVDFEPLLKDLNAQNLAARTGNLSVAVLAAATPLLAADQSLDIDEIKGTIEFVDKMKMASDAEPAAPAAADADPDDAGAVDADPDDDDDEKKAAAAKKKAEDEAAASAAAAEDEDPDKAMDSRTVAAMISDAVGRERERSAAIAQALVDVAPHIGQVTGAMDSAASVYKLALDAANVNLTGVPNSSFRHMVAMLPKPGDRAAGHTALVAMDAAADSDFRKRFPTAGHPARA